MMFPTICGTKCLMPYLQVLIFILSQVNPLHSLKPFPFKNMFFLLITYLHLLLSDYLQVFETNFDDS